VLEELCDAYWVSDNYEASSTGSYAFILGEYISWKFVKQTYVGRSIMEAEFIAFELVGQEVE